jgi:short-subunit dehydrogenase
MPIIYISAVLNACCKFHDTQKFLLIVKSINMPEITDSNALILVTGATGFIGTWIVETLLRNGYKVRAAVRTEEKGQHLLEIFGNYGTKLTLSVIGDMSKVKAPKSPSIFLQCAHCRM